MSKTKRDGRRGHGRGRCRAGARIRARLKQACLAGWSLVTAGTAVVAIAGPTTVTAAEGGFAQRWVFEQGRDLGWGGNRDLEVKAGVDSLAFTYNGMDPWLEGPVLDDERLIGRPSWLRLRLRSTGAGPGEVFHGPRFTASDRVGFPVRHDGAWHEYEVSLPPLPPGSRLRIDPSAGPGEGALAWIEIEPFEVLPPVELTPARWSGAAAPDAPSLDVGAGVRIAAGPDGWSDLRVTVDGIEIAANHPGPRIAFVNRSGALAYVPLQGMSAPEFHATEAGWESRAATRDEEGGTWSLTRRVTAVSGHPGVADISLEVACDAERRVVHLPLVDLLAWPGEGPEKAQAILPGVDYLGDEPSGSEADVRGPKSRRRIVDDLQLTLPMMAVAKNGTWVGIAWERTTHPAPVFDSPDRLHGSGGHAMGLWWPGVGRAREENALSVRAPMIIPANAPLVFRHVLMAGAGDTVVPAVRTFVALRGLPPVPPIEGGLEGAGRLMAAGWLDSAARAGGRWRHAVWGDRFPASPAADAVGFLWWLADRGSFSEARRAELLSAAAAGAAEFGENDPLLASVGHVQRPVVPLLFGDVEAAMNARADRGWSALRRFDERGVVPYRRRPEGPDYAETNPRDHETGTTGNALVQALEGALVSGDPELTEAALERLRQALEIYRNDIPRGAQTWEVPLHTPDILAAAHMVRACVLGHHLDGDSRWLEEAEYWAWTGVPFVYLDPPVAGVPVGTFAVIAVLGATNWEAPYWIGLPVQWCGLVYRSALLDLADALRFAPGTAGSAGEHPVAAERSRFWKHLADGITASGLQQTFPLDDRERGGLLPDFFHLRTQIPDGPAINPGTVQAGLPELLGLGRHYSERRAGGPDGPILMVPGAIESVTLDQSGEVRARILAWPQRPWRARLTRLPGPPEEVAWQAPGAAVPERLPPSAWRYEPEGRALTVELPATAGERASGELLVRPR